MGVVGVNNGTGLSQGCEVLLGGGRIVGVVWSHGAVGIDNQLGLDSSQSTG